MYKYPKIETVYKRSTEGTKSLIIGDWRSDTIEMLAPYRIWDGYEKLDGSNHQIHWDGHRLNLLGRTESSNIPKHVTKYYETKFNNNETEELFEQLFGEKEYVLYFEAIGTKIQSCGGLYGDVRFVLLDVYNIANDSWWRYDCKDDPSLEQYTIKGVAKALGIECKKLVMQGTIDDMIDFVKSRPISFFAKEGSDLVMEGVVVVPKVELKYANGNRVIVKIKLCDFS